MGWRSSLFQTKRELPHFDLKAYLKATYEKKIATTEIIPDRTDFARLMDDMLTNFESTSAVIYLSTTSPTGDSNGRSWPRWDFRPGQSAQDAISTESLKHVSTQCSA
jgi:hypothetical protein